MSSNSPILARLGGDFVRAGDLYYEQGRWAKAVDMYVKAGRRKQAAKICVEIGDLEQAVRLSLEDGEPRLAGQLLAENGDHKRAIQHFEAARAFWPAAESALALGQHTRAGGYFQRAGAWNRAARCFEQAGEPGRALEAWAREAQRLAEEARGGDASAREEMRQVDLHRAELLARLGEHVQAAEIYQRWGFLTRAGDLFEQGQDHDRAASAYLEGKRPERALAVLREDSGLDAVVRARIYALNDRHEEAGALFQEAGQEEEAARELETAGKWREAAELWVNLELPEHAADLYYRAEDWKRAGTLFVQAGRPELAAETFVKAGDPAAAADCYRKTDQPLRAAQQYIEAGLKDVAGEMLQEISPRHPEFEEATTLLVELLVEEGVYEGALHRIKLLEEDSSGTGQRSLERLYWEARAHEGLEQFTEAEKRYEQVVALRRGHRDVTERLQAVRKSAKEQRNSGLHQTTTTGIASPAETGRMPIPEDGFEAGDVLAERYEILGELGKGGMSRVYRARDRELNETVAVKMMLPRFVSDDQKRLLQEVQISRRITHPNVVRVYDMGRFQGGVFVTMELLEGEDLEKRIRGDERIPLPRVKELLSEILAGLGAAHQLKIIHRDLKPRNIILTAAGVKILDFGIARVEGADLGLTGAGQIMGSPLYMSPEQVRGEALDARSDLYCVGVLTFAMLSGREPFQGKSAESVALKQLHEPPPDLDTLRPGLGHGWKTFVGRLLAKDRDKRHGTASEVMAALEMVPAED